MTALFHMTTDCMVRIAQDAERRAGKPVSDPQSYMQWAHRESPLHTYMGGDWWEVVSEVKRGAYTAWPNPWTTPENQEKRK